MEIWHITERIARGILRRRKLLLLASTATVMVALLPAAFYLSKEPPRFKTSAVVLIETRPGRVPLFQEFSPFRPLPVQLAILRSRTLAETVLETLPKSSVQDLTDNPYYVDWQQKVRNAYLRLRGQEPETESPQARALKELQQARASFGVNRDGIVTITAEASKPQISLDIVNTYVEVLMARTRSFNIDDSRVTREFLEQQLADIKKKLGTSEETLRAFVSAHGGVKIPERSQATVARLAQSESSLAEAEANRKMLQARVESLRQKAETQKGAAGKSPTPAATLAAPSAELQRLRAQLAKLEGSLLELRTKFTEEHPRVRLVHARIAEIQSQLGGAIKETGPIVPMPDAVPVAERINFGEQVIALEASFHSVSAQEEALRKQVESLRQSLKGLSASEVEYTRLNREADSTRTLHAMVADKLTAARVREQGEMKVVKVIDPPGQPVRSLGDRRLKVLFGSLVLALIAGAGIPAAVEWRRKPIDTADDVDMASGLPTLGLIPRIRSRRPLFVAQYDTGRGRPSEQLMFTESFRALRVSIQLAMKAAGIRTVLVASPYAHEGKSMVVVNLALALNEVGVRVLIADSDLHRPMLHRTLKIEQSKGGLVKALHAEQPLDDTMTQVGDSMWLLPRGESVYSHTRGMFASGRMAELLDEMKTKVELVICDSSPVLLIPDNLFLAGAVDAVLLVAKAGSTGGRELNQAKEMLEGAGGKILGVVLNEVPVSVLRGQYNRYYHSYLKRGA